MEIRKLYTAIEETFGEMDRMADEPLRKVAAIAVVKNHLAGKSPRSCSWTRCWLWGIMPSRRSA